MFTNVISKNEFKKIKKNFVKLFTMQGIPKSDAKKMVDGNFGESYEGFLSFLDDNPEDISNMKKILSMKLEK